jgi:hypothetical protein
MLIVTTADNDLVHNLVASLSWISLQSRELTVGEPGLGASRRIGSTDQAIELDRRAWASAS